MSETWKPGRWIAPTDRDALGDWLTDALDRCNARDDYGLPHRPADLGWMLADELLASPWMSAAGATSLDPDLIGVGTPGATRPLKEADPKEYARLDAAARVALATPAAEPGLREAAAGVRSLAVEGASLLHLSGAGIVGRHNGKWTECEHGRCVAYRERIAALDRALAISAAEPGLDNLRIGDDGKYHCGGCDAHDQR